MALRLLQATEKRRRCCGVSAVQCEVRTLRHVLHNTIMAPKMKNPRQGGKPATWAGKRIQRKDQPTDGGQAGKKGGCASPAAQRVWRGYEWAARLSSPVYVDKATMAEQQALMSRDNGNCCLILALLAFHQRGQPTGFFDRERWDTVQGRYVNGVLGAYSKEYGCQVALYTLSVRGSLRPECVFGSGVRRHILVLPGGDGGLHALPMGKPDLTAVVEIPPLILEDIEGGDAARVAAAAPGAGVAQAKGPAPAAGGPAEAPAPANDPAVAEEVVGPVVLPEPAADGPPVLPPAGQQEPDQAPGPGQPAGPPAQEPEAGVEEGGVADGVDNAPPPPPGAPDAAAGLDYGEDYPSYCGIQPPPADLLEAAIRADFRRRVAEAEYGPALTEDCQADHWRLTEGGRAIIEAESRARAHDCWWGGWFSSQCSTSVGVAKAVKAAVWWPKFASATADMFELYGTKPRYLDVRFVDGLVRLDSRVVTDSVQSTQYFTAGDTITSGARSWVVKRVAGFLRVEPTSLRSKYSMAKQRGGARVTAPAIQLSDESRAKAEWAAVTLSNAHPLETAILTRMRADQAAERWRGPQATEAAALVNVLCQRYRCAPNVSGPYGWGYCFSCGSPAQGKLNQRICRECQGKNTMLGRMVAEGCKVTSNAVPVRYPGVVHTRSRHPPLKSGVETVATERNFRTPRRY